MSAGKAGLANVGITSQVPNYHFGGTGFLATTTKSTIPSFTLDIDPMATTTNVVNLDAMIRRADLASPGEAGEDVPALSVPQLERTGFLYPALRKPDFQRETAHWSPEQVADLIGTFARRDLIPAVILWRAGQNVFVIDGAHRLSALIAWVHDDYGDKEVSRKMFQDIPDEQIAAAEKTRSLVGDAVGSYRDHKLALEYPDKVKPDIAERAGRIGWQNIPAQWIQTHDHDRAEKSFFRINQGGTKIDPTERRIINARLSATALASRAILRGGSGHDYWDKFDKPTQERIEALGKEVHNLLFDPTLTLPIKTLDVPIAGQGYGPHVLPLVFDLVNLVNDVAVADSSNKRITKEESFVKDTDGTKTVEYLISTREMVRRICSTYPSSLGLHPALYFYSPSGVFQTGALLAFITLFKDWDTNKFKSFTVARSKFEEFLLTHRGITEAVRKLGSGARSRPRILALYRTIFSNIEGGKTPQELHNILAENSDFAFLVVEPPEKASSPGKSFNREVKGGAFLQGALHIAPKCPTCAGLLHRNGMQTGHREHKRLGGSDSLANAQIQHPFCNSTMDN
jgi:hypothetical protein